MKNGYIGELSRYSIVYLLLLSVFISLKGWYSVNEFEKQNFPIYDGVIYEYQQNRRFLKFENDFSFKSRISQAIYEFESNPVSGLYNSIVILISPSMLSNDIEVIIRSFLGFFLFSLSVYYFLINKYKPIWILMLITILAHSPLFYHYRIGIGSYVPELVSAIYLMAGYLFLIVYIDTKRKILFILGLICFFIPIAFRFNFFAYLLLISLPVLIKLLINWKSFHSKDWKFIVIFSIPVLIVFVGNICYHFAAFYHYYTSVLYAVVSVPASLNYLLSNFSEYFGWYGFIACVLIFIGNSFFSVDNHYSKRCNFQSFGITFYPFIIFFVFFVFIMKSTNTPHIISIIAFFCLICVFLISFKTEPSSIKYIFIVSLSFLFILFTNYNDFNRFSKTNKEDEYEAHRFVSEYVAKKGVNSVLNVFDAMIEIPMNVRIFELKGKFIDSDEHFYTSDAHLTENCHSIKFCTEKYKKIINQLDLIVINENENDNYIEPLAKATRKNLRNLLKVSNNHKLVLNYPTKYYGNLLFYKTLRNP